MGDNGGGMKAVTDYYLNLWAGEAGAVGLFTCCAMKTCARTAAGAAPPAGLHAGRAATDADVEAAVEYSSYENMKKMESKSSSVLPAAA